MCSAQAGCKLASVSVCEVPGDSLGVGACLLCAVLLSFWCESHTGSLARSNCCLCSCFISHVGSTQASHTVCFITCHELHHSLGSKLMPVSCAAVLCAPSHLPQVMSRGTRKTRVAAAVEVLLVCMWQHMQDFL